MGGVVVSTKYIEIVEGGIWGAVVKLDVLSIMTKSSHLQIFMFYILLTRSL